MAAEYKGKGQDRDASRPDGYSKSRKPSKGRPKRRQKPSADVPSSRNRPPGPIGPVAGPGMGFPGGQMGAPAAPIFPGMA